MRFSATVVVGNRKGKVGLGTGKAKEMPDAVRKARDAAVKNLINELTLNFSNLSDVILKNLYKLSKSINYAVFDKREKKCNPRGNCVHIY